MPTTPPKTSTGFVSLMDYLNANRPAVNGTAGQLVAGASTDADRARGLADTVGTDTRAGTKGDASFDATTLGGYGKAQDAAAQAQQKLGGLTSFGGLSQQLQDRSSGPYSAGDRALDSNLLLGGAGSQMRATQAKYGGLMDYLNTQTANGRAAGLADAAPKPPTTHARPTPETDDGEPMNPGVVKNNPRARRPDPFTGGNNYGGGF